MAQGLQKLNSKKPTPSIRHSKTSKTPKGPRVIAPKKAKLMKKQKATKKFSSALAAKTELALAQKAGHLEILKGGKKDLKEKASK